VLLPGVGEQLQANDGVLLRTIQDEANIQLLLNDEGTAVRLDGLDGVGREIARRALSRLGKPKHQADAAADAVAWITKLKEQLAREIANLGKKAFSVLQVKRADPEIVDLVGRLNFRTSYTQNQWLHAVEASFLAGMMADELGLDLKLARRACLMHDIGKSLTHEIEGSHAVIGADIARRLGEDEIIANAIGSHHADEPANSAYALLVAAGDAMSGARPGARRMMTTEYGSRIEDLERIGASYRGVDRAYAVHGGRELRVYVREGQLTDGEAIELSTSIAGRITDEMTFPGQIKVTVIRAYEAVSVAN
jgi:ribonuclease Y